MKKTTRLVAGAAVLLACVHTSGAETLVAISDSILLQNGTPGPGGGDAEDNYGGRTEVIIGANGANPRHGLFRFDVSSLIGPISAGATVDTATFTIYERESRDTNNGANSQAFSIYALVADNADWVEGTSGGSAPDYSALPGTVSYSYRAAPSVYGATDGLRWFSQGGGATLASGLGTPTTFQFGTDTGAALGTGTVAFAAGNADSLVISLDAAAIQALLPQWLADGANNAGLAIESAGSTQLFFESIEGDAEAAGGPTAATLDVTFVPFPGDADFDGILDVNETNNGSNSYVSPTNTGTDPAVWDSDGDGIGDGDEIDTGTGTTVFTDPTTDDTDGDTLLDQWELANSLDPNVSTGDDGASGDPDGDLLVNSDEQNNPAGYDPTDPQDADSDDDDLDDNKETLGSANGDFANETTDPNNPDSDSDGLNDGAETSGSLNPFLNSVLDAGFPAVDGDPTDPNYDDTDGDGLLDKEETDNRLDPNDPTGDNGFDGDSDGDNLYNDEEIRTFGTDPRNPDTDGDGLNDDEEIDTFLTDPTDADSDDDGIDDGVEVDGTANTVSGQATDPADADSDDDGIDDGDELDVATGSAYLTDPAERDTDGDGFADGTEIDFGTDPTLATSYPDFYPNLVAYWPLDNATGNEAVLKAGTGSVNGVFQNTTGLTWVLGVGEGICGYADMNNSPNSHFKIDSISGLDGKSAYTMMGWFKPRDITGYNGLFMSRSVDDGNTNESWGIGVSNNRLDHRHSNDAGYSGNVLTLDTWQHVATTWDGTTKKTYLNGVEILSATTPSTAAIVTSGFWLLGNDPNQSNREVNAAVDDWAVFDTAIPVDVIDNVYQAGLNGDNLLTQFPSAPTNLVDDDSDNDGICDQWEWDLFGNLDSDFSPTSDIDGDGLPDFDELDIHGTNPNDEDTDNDGIWDGAEVNGTDNVAYSNTPTDPLDDDSDDDGILDGDEVDAGTGSMIVTNPADRDTDRDGVSDDQELLDGTDPTNPAEAILPMVTGNMVSYYNFDEGTGAVANDTAVAGTAQEQAQTASGTIDWNTIDPLIGGSSLSLDGATDMKAATPLTTSTTAFTVSVWVYSDSFNGDREGIYVHRGATGAEYWGITIDPNGANNGTDFRVSNNGHSVPDGFVVAGKWQHFAITWDGAAGLARTFIDGVERGSKSGVAGTFNATADLWYIGSDDNAANRRMTGQLDDLAIFDTIVSDADIQSIADAGNAGIPISVLLGLVQTPIEITQVETNVPAADDVTITWESAGLGATFTVRSTIDPATNQDPSLWPVLDAAVANGGATTSFTHTGILSTEDTLYYVIEEN